MLHLLTEEHRQKVVREYRKRVLVVFFLGLFFVFIVSLVFVLPTFFLSYGKYADFQSKKQMLDSELAVKEDAGSSESIKSITTSIEALKMFDSKKDIHVLLEGLIRERPVGIQIKNIIFTPSEAETMVVDLAGRADTRKSLVAFDQKLKSNPLFAEVVVPLASFAKEKNIDFSMKIFISTSTKAFELSSTAVNGISIIPTNPQKDEKQN